MKSFVLSAFVMVLASIAFAPAVRAADPGITQSFKNEQDPSSHRADVTKAVADQVAKLGNDADPVAQSAAKDWLINEAVNGTAAATSTGYLVLYSDVLNSALLPVVKSPDATARAKANAALIAGKVSEVGGTTNMLPTILAALGEQNDGIAILAEKSAGQILPPLFKNPNGAKDQKALLDAIVADVSQHLATQRAGLIAEDAYSSLNPNLRAGIVVSQATDVALADAVIQLQKVRLAVYKTSIPDSPDVDPPGTLFLMDRQRWNTLTPAQQLAAMQNAVDLIWSAAQRARDLPSNLNQELIHAICHTAQMIHSVAVNNINNQALADVTQKVMNLQIGTAGYVIIDACKAVYPAVRDASPVFKDLKAPAELQPLPKPAK